MRVKLAIKAKAWARGARCAADDIVFYDLGDSREVVHRRVAIDCTPSEWVEVRASILLHNFAFEGLAEVAYEPPVPCAGYPRTECIRRLSITPRVPDAMPGGVLGGVPLLGSDLQALDLDTGYYLPFSRLTLLQPTDGSDLLVRLVVPDTKDAVLSPERQALYHTHRTHRTPT